VKKIIYHTLFAARINSNVFSFQLIKGLNKNTNTWQ